MENIKEKISELAKTKNLDEAKELNDAWIEKEKNNPSAWSTLAHVHSLSKDFDSAKQAILKSIELSPNEPASQFKLGRIEFARNDIDSSLQAFEKCIALSNTLNWDYYTDSAKLSQAQCLVLKGEKEKALSIASQVSPHTSVWLGGYITPSKIISESVKS